MDCSSREILQFDDAYIELIENYPCVDKNELHRREGEIIRERVCVNKVIAGRTDAEYREDNKETRNQYSKQYRQEHTEEANQYNKQYQQTHKESIAEQKKPYNKQYEIDNKEAISSL